MLFYLFENSDYNVCEISNICGIEDSLYFSRMFKKQTGKENDEELNKYVHAFAKRKFNTGFRHEMNRSVRAIISHWTKK